MINIFRERFLKKNLLASFILILVGFLSFTFIIDIGLKKLYENELIRYANIIGQAKSVYGDDEKILEILLDNNSNDEYVEKGLEKLNEYGYTADKGLQDKWVGKSFKDMKIKILSLGGVLFIALFIVFIFVVEGLLKKIRKVSEGLRNLSEGKEYKKLEDNEEGEISLLNHRLNITASRLEGKIDAMEAERNGVKELLSDLSHQLKTPIASLKMNNELILDGYASPKEEKEFLKNNTENIEKMEWITDGLLKLSRLEAHFISLDKKERSLKDTLVKSINSVYGKAKSKNIELNIGKIEEGLFIHDEKWTSEAIVNIIDNAIKYSIENSNINISLKNLDWKSEIIIEDFGYGIEDSHKENIFKRFYRGNNKEVQGQEGSGIGLYLSKKIIELQGGTIKFSSKVGYGSTFTVTFYKHIAS